MGGLTPVHLIIVLVIALLVIGPGKLPDTGAALGRAIRDFRHAVSDDPQAPAPAAPAPAATAPAAPAPVSAVPAPAPAVSAPAPAASVSTVPSDAAAPVPPESVNS